MKTLITFILILLSFSLHSQEYVYNGIKNIEPTFKSNSEKDDETLKPIDDPADREAWQTYLSNSGCSANVANGGDIDCRYTSLSIEDPDFPTNTILGLDYTDNIMFTKSGLEHIDFLYGLTRGTFMYFNYNKLKNVNGLQSLQYSGEHLWLDNNQLTNVHGLKNLVYVDRRFELHNNNLTNLKGLEKLDRVGKFRLNNNQLISLEGLENFDRVLEGHFYIDGNPNLSDISAIENMSYIRYYIYTNEGQTFNIYPSEGSSFCLNNLYNKFRNIDSNTANTAAISEAKAACNL